MSHHQHMQERLAGNSRIVRHGSSLAPSATWLSALGPAVMGIGGLTIRGLRAALRSPDAAVLGAAERVKACIAQPEWLASLLASPVPCADWLQSPCGGQVYWQAGPGGGKGFSVRPDGRLATLDDAQGGGADWQPACVVWCPVAKGQHLLATVPAPAHLVKEAPSEFDPDASKLQPYLLGAWQAVWVDPNAWAVGPLPVSHFLVKAAARRLLLLGLRAGVAGFSVVDGHRPRLWPGPGGCEGLLWLEQRWHTAYTSKCASLRARMGLARRRVEVAVGPQQPAVVVERVSPYERAAAALVRRGHHSAGFADAADVLLAGVQGGCTHRPEWRKAYELLQLPRLDRITRHFGWRLVHGALRCSAAAVTWCKLSSIQAMQATVCCTAAACAATPQLETLSHVFVHCPVVRPAVEWLRALWTRLVPGDIVPLDARVLLAGDHTVWAPGGGDAGLELWAHLRLLFCRAVWHMRCRRVSGGRHEFSSSAVVAMAAAWVEHAVRLDWLRVSTDLAGASTALPSWCVIHKRFDLSQEDFARRWCLGAVLAHVSTDETGSRALCVHVPVAVPGGVGPAAGPP